MGEEDRARTGEPALSLHRRILDDIESRIMSGEWPPGHRIPFEHELTERYGCSRMTVNKALTQLAKAGLIERKRKSGSFVSFPHSQAAILEIHDIRDEVAALGLPYRFELLKRRERPSGPADTGMPDIPRNTPLLELLCRHYAGARVFALEERIINLHAVPEAVRTDFAESSPGPWLVACVPWSNAQHSIRATAVTPHNAGLLAVAAGSPCLVIERQTWNAGQPVGQQLCLAATARRQRTVFEPVLRVEMLSVSHEVQVMRHVNTRLAWGWGSSTLRQADAARPGLDSAARRRPDYWIARAISARCARLRRAPTPCTSSST